MSTEKVVLDIQTLFRSAELTKLMITNGSDEGLKSLSELGVRFWLASTLVSPKNTKSGKKSVESRKLRSLCIEIDSQADDLEVKLTPQIVQEFRKFGWLQYKERKNEIFSPLYSWQQFLPIQKIGQDLQSKIIWSHSIRQSMDVQCKYIGSQIQCSTALTCALEIAQSTPVNWTRAYQLKTVIPTNIIRNSILGPNSSVFSFVFMNIDHYFLDWLEKESGFLIDLVFPSLHASGVDFDHLAQMQADLYYDIWSKSQFHRLSKLETMSNMSSNLNWTDVSVQAHLKWSITDSQTYFLPSLESYLPKLDAILVSSELINEIRLFFSSLNTLYSEIYSLALVEVNHQSYYLINLAKRPCFNQRSHKQSISYYWNEEHIKLLTEFMMEIKHIDADQAFFFQCISKEPLLYLGLESDLVPHLKPFEVLRLLQVESTDQSEKKLSLLSPFLSKIQEKEEVYCFQMPKPKFYRHEEFSLILHPQRFSRIKQWFDESFICFSPQAFDDES